MKYKKNVKYQKQNYKNRYKITLIYKTKFKKTKSQFSRLSKQLLTVMISKNKYHNKNCYLKTIKKK